MPIPLMYMDTTWKFKDMTPFLNEKAYELGFELLIQTNHKENNDGETLDKRKIHLGTFGRYPRTAGVDSDVNTMEQLAREGIQLTLSERATRLIDGDKQDSMEKKKTEGYF